MRLEIWTNLRLAGTELGPTPLEDRMEDPALGRVLGDLVDESYSYLSQVREEGSTFFTSVQVRALYPELNRLLTAARDASETRTVTTVIEFAERVESIVHTYLVFIGEEATVGSS